MTSPSAIEPERIERLRAALAGRYTLHGEIGRGGMATVYMAEDLKHGRNVAVKILSPDLAASIGSTRFLLEIRTAAGLMHPNILGLIDSGEAAGLLYYIMPFVRGETLRSKLDREKKLSVPDACKIALEVAGALEHAHAHGIIHRDIKPGNVLLVDGKHATVADFGLARAVYTAVSDATAPGLILGTPHYMSPEQVNGSQHVDGRSDIYGLGCLLFEMLAGEPPFGGPSLQQVLTGHLVEEPPRLRSKRADIPFAIERVVQRALEKNPDKRFPLAADFSSSLRAAVEPMPWRRSVGLRWAALGIVAVLAVVLVLVPDTVGVRQMLGGFLAPARDTSSYVILPFRLAPGTASSEGAESMLGDALENWDSLKVVPQFQVRDRWSMTDTSHLSERAALKIASDLRAGRLVWGDVARAGDSMRVAVVLYDVASGKRLTHQTVHFASNSADLGTPFVRLASALIVRDGTPSLKGHDDANTRSVPAYRAFRAGQAAFAVLDLLAADSAFARALRYDPAYPAANLWLGQVRGWTSENPADWTALASRAVAGQNRLPPYERKLAQALLFLATKKYPDACAVYASMKADDPTDFIAAFGLGECISRDKLVISDARSPSHWAFRSSIHRAVISYRDAFNLVPSIHRAYIGRAFARVQALLFTSARNLRIGEAEGDTTQFRATASWDVKADTLAFVPWPALTLVREPARATSSTAAIALVRQRRLFNEIAKSWRAAYPQSVESMQAMAVSLELLGDSTAVDSLRLARQLSTDDEQRLELGASEVLLIVKFALPDNTAQLQRAHALADSLLRLHAPESGPHSKYLASLAALLGKADETARLARLMKPGRVPPGISGRTAATAQALEAYAALGGPTDSIKALEARFLRDVRLSVPASQLVTVENRMLGRAAILSFPTQALRSIQDYNNPFVDAANAFAGGDRTRARASLHSDGAIRATLNPADRSLDVTFAGAWLLNAAGDAESAVAWLDPVLRALHLAAPQNLNELSNVAALVRGAALRAQLARDAGDLPEARTWARAVTILWKDADPALQGVVSEMKQILSSPQR